MHDEQETNYQQNLQMKYDKEKHNQDINNGQKYF